MHFNRFTHVNDTPDVQNSQILQFSKIRPQSLHNVIIPWSIKYMWFNAAHSLLILTSPNCSLIRGHFPVWCGGRCTAPGGVGLRTMSGRLRAASGRLLVGPRLIDSNFINRLGKITESVHCTVTGTCLRMRHRSLARTLQLVTAPIQNIYHRLLFSDLC